MICYIYTYIYPKNIQTNTNIVGITYIHIPRKTTLASPRCWPGEVDPFGRVGRSRRETLAEVIPNKQPTGD